jgi:hypothetical protein
VPCYASSSPHCAPRLSRVSGREACAAAAGGICCAVALGVVTRQLDILLLLAHSLFLPRQGLRRLDGATPCVSAPLANKGADLLTTAVLRLPSIRIGRAPHRHYRALTLGGEPDERTPGWSGAPHAPDAGLYHG